MKETFQEINKYDKEFGMIALQRRYISQDELFHAHKMQLQEQIVNGRQRLLADIFFYLDFMSPRQIDDVVKDQFKNN